MSRSSIFCHFIFEKLFLIIFSYFLPFQITNRTLKDLEVGLNQNMKKFKFLKIQRTDMLKPLNKKKTSPYDSWLLFSTFVVIKKAKEV